MKVLIIFPDFQKGGIERNCSIWASFISDFASVKIYVKNKIALDHYQLQKYYTDWKGISEFDPDVVINFRGLKELFGLWRFRKKTYVRLSNNRNRWFYERSIKALVAEGAKFLLYRLCAGLIANSSDLKDQYKYYNNKVVVINNSIGIVANEVRGPSVAPPKLVFAGRHCKQKNLSLALCAVNRLKQAGLEIDLTVLTSNRAEVLHAFGHLLRGVSIYEWSSTQFLKGFDMLLLPSLYEGSPNIMLEAFNAGLLVARTPFKCGGAELESAFNRRSFVSDDFSVESYADSISQCISYRAHQHISTTTPYLYTHEKLKADLKKLLRDEL